MLKSILLLKLLEMSFCEKIHRTADGYTCIENPREKAVCDDVHHCIQLSEFGGIG